MRKAVRQGDDVNTLGDNHGRAHCTNEAAVTVAEGEQTGHHHSIAANAAIAAFLGPDGQFIEGSKKMKLSHQEHSSP